MGLYDMVAIQGSDLDVTVDGDGFLRFIYFEELVSADATSYISIPDQSASENISGPATTGFGTQTVTINDSITFPFSNSEEIYQAILKAGTLDVNISHNYQHDISITLTLPTAINGGSPFSQTYDLSYTGFVPVNASGSHDMSDYDIDLTNGGGSFNTLPYTIEMTITENVPNPVLGIENISLSADFTGLQYSYLRGYMGQFNIPFNLDTVDIDIFDNSANFASFFFTDPKARFEFHNSFGIPIEADIDTLTTELNDGTPLTITGTYDDSPVAIDYPNLAEAGQTIISEFVIDNTNSNIDDAFNPAPNKMYFQVTGTANAAGPVENFVTDTSRLVVFGEAEIPMDGRVSGFVLADTVTDMELPDTTEDGYEELNFVKFKIETENGFPMDARIQCYFLDSNDVLLDTLFHNNDNFASSASIDGDGKVTTSTKTFLETTIDKERYKTIMPATTMIIVGTISTTNGGATSVKIYDSYYINIQMGALVNGTIDLDDL